MSEPAPAGAGPSVAFGLSIRATFIVLLITTVLFGLGSGLFGTLLGVRATQEGFSTGATGLIMSAYFLGFILGAFVCVEVVARVGHVRAFAAFAAIATAMALSHAIWVDVIPWVVFRFVAGVVMVGVALVIESWLNAGTNAQNRGRVFATYMVANLSALALGQLLLTTQDPAGFQLFAFVAILFALCLVPTAVARVQTPLPHEPTGLGALELLRRSPVGVIGCFAVGLVGGGFWGMAPVFATQLGYDEARVALFMSTAIVGGMVAQIPVGRFSDGRDRRKVIAGMAILAAGASLFVYLQATGAFALLALGAFLFGATKFPLYGLAVARAHDVLRPEEALEATRGLMLVFGIGAAIGPFVAGLVMGAVGPAILFGWFGLVFGGLALFSLYRLARTDPIPIPDQTVFVPHFQTSPEAVELAEGEGGLDELETARVGGT
ncbi:MAG: MFS transporter [Geminicoccaceae bacterium]|nr:MAG: MFS transporter [Geminicoccaceae bacterium]